jgi:hypothetical protein
LGKLRQLHNGVGAEEAGNYGVIQPPVHVDDFPLGVVLVSGKAAGGEGEAAPVFRVEILSRRFVGKVAPGVKAVALHHLRTVGGNGTIAAHMGKGEGRRKNGERKNIPFKI